MIVGHIGGASSPYEIQKSLRFRANASAYLSRTPSIAGNRKTWTWSGWVKRGTQGTSQCLFAARTGVGASYTIFRFGADTLSFEDNMITTLTTASVYRDPSAHMHLQIAVDTTQATAADRVKLYVNGVRVSWSTGTYPALNADFQVNSTQTHLHGQQASGQYLDGYLSEINFIDGQALDPSYFGEFSAETGSWIPKKYTGTYGTNGFYLPFNDGSNLTNLTADRSGNGNNWTANNISLTSGSSYDWMDDTPTNNFAVLNPLDRNTSMAVASGNLDVTKSGSGYGVVRSSIGVSSGKWYWEAAVVGVANSTGSAGRANIGVQTSAGNLNSFIGSDSFGWMYNFDGVKQPGGTAYGASYVTNDVIGVALDMDAGTLTFYKNGVSQGTAFSSLSGAMFPSYSADSTGNTSGWIVNHGQRPFAYTPPTGFKALCTKNLPTPSILNPKKHFDVVLATGANIKSTVEALYSDQALMVVKDRANANNWQWFNDVTGLSAVLQSNTTGAETTYSAPPGSSVGWAWKAGGAPVTNNAGSIQSQVSANPQAGFSIVTYTGTGANATVGHGLGVAPKMVIFKSRGPTARNWLVDIGGVTGVTGDYLYLNQTQLKQNSANVLGATSSVVNLGNTPESNAAEGFVAYCFAEVPGFSKIGSYTGNGSADGPFVYCGFRPRFLLVKRTDVAQDWFTWDASRMGYNQSNYLLFANSSQAEYSGTESNVDLLSNGFKIRAASPPAVGSNASGGTYIFIAFAEAPFQFANAR